MIAAKTVSAAICVLGVGIAGVSAALDAPKSGCRVLVDDAAAPYW